MDRKALIQSAAALLIAAIPTIAAAQPVRIPLCPGLTIVTAIDAPDGDYETIKTIQSVGARGVSLSVSVQRRVQSVVRSFTIQRTVLPADLSAATLYMHHFVTRAPIRIPGSTALGTSSAVLRALKRNGMAELGLVEGSNSAFPADANVHPNVYDFRMNYALTRVGNGSVPVPVTVNDVRVELPAVRAEGEYIGEKAEFLFLDDERNPLALRYRIGRSDAGAADDESLRLQVVKISHRCPATEPAKAAAPAGRLEQALLETGRADVYDIYFDFDSDRLRAESEPTMREIAGLLRKHPDWKLAVEGHTDSIASDTFNLDLSRRRAVAVKGALVASHEVAAARLTTAGFGESRPRDTNDTLEGRARNRRVELVRHP
jgi:outer membrane protein OmpA-like peptidoglycan-associated protein